MKSQTSLWKPDPNEQTFKGHQSLGLFYLWIDSQGLPYLFCFTCDDWIPAGDITPHRTLRAGGH